jgi:hypothetical protein
MPKCVEFVRFRVKEGQLAAFLARRSEAIPAIREAHPDLLGAPVLAEHQDGSWTDIWLYRTAAAAERANAGASEIPEFVAMAELLEDVQVDAASMPDAVPDASCPPGSEWK